MLIPYGHHKAKIPLDAVGSREGRGKLIVVTGMTPTPAGEGKTTTTVGLTQAMGLLGVNVAATLREPSLGPIFGIKGGGTGGGMARVEPEDEVNIHFTGDAHAVGVGAQPAGGADGQRGAARSGDGHVAGGDHAAPRVRHGGAVAAAGGDWDWGCEQRADAGDGVRHRVGL